jgi:hypothetical protein
MYQNNVLRYTSVDPNSMETIYDSTDNCSTVAWKFEIKWITGGTISYTVVTMNAN